MSSVTLASVVAAVGGSQSAAPPATQISAAVEAALGQIGAAVEAVALEQLGTLANLPAVSASPASAQPTDPATVAQSLATAIMRDAAARQNGLAPLYANLEAALARPGASLPQPVRTAAEQLLGLRLDPGAAIHLDGNDIKTALARSGLSAAAEAGGSIPPTAGSPDLKSALLSLQGALKSWIDNAPAAASTTLPDATSPSPAQPQPTQPQPSQSEPDQPEPAITASTADLDAPMPPDRNAPAVPQTPATVTMPPGAAPRSLALNLLAATSKALAIATAIAPGKIAPQPGLAPIYSNLEAALAQPGANLPQPVRAAADQLLGLGLGLRLEPDAATNPASNNIKSALAQPDPGAALDADPNASSAAGAGDLKGALQSLQDALKSWIDSTAAAEPDAAPTSPGEPQPSALQAAPPQASAASAAEPQAAARAAAPMPPYRDAPTVPQAPAAVTLPPDASSRDIALHLLVATDAALARHTLLQIASLPDAPAAGPARPDQASTRATFDIPLATPQGTAVAQFRIERDGRRRQGADQRPVWLACFSIDLEPIGPVHARIALTGDRTTVTIHAERPDSADRLRGGLALLQAGLREAALDPGDIQCRAGAPTAAPAAPGLFVDHAS